MEFCQSNNLNIANTIFEHHPRHLYTWTSPDKKTRNQIDYITIDQKWKSTLKNAKTRPGADCNTDHQLLVIEMQVRLKKLNKVINPVRLEYTSFNNEYNVKVSNSCETLLKLDEEKSPNEIWQEGKDTILRVAKSIFPKKNRTQNRWISKETMEEVENQRKLRAKGIKTEIERTLYAVRNAKGKTLMRKDKEKFINEQCHHIEENSIVHSLKDLYQGVRRLTRKFNPRIDSVKCEDGTVLCESDEMKQRWKQYCCNLYKKNGAILEGAPPNSYNNIAEPAPLYSEVDKAISELKNNKSPGIDEVVAELIKNGGHQMVAFFHKLCTAIWIKKEWPVDWVNSIFTSIPKKGDVLQCNNNRTIALISHCSKILLKIISNRMKPKMEEEINETQAGFRTGAGTRNQILNLKLIIEKNR